MANAKALTICPRCEGETQQGDKTCPHCGFRLVVPENKTFEVPGYIHEQRQNELKRIELETKSTEQTSANPKLRKLDIDFQAFWQECDDQTRIGAMRDALSCIKHMVQSRASIECVRQVSGIAKEIGKLGSSIDEYFRHGGAYNGARLPEATASSTDPEGEEHTGGARVTPLL